MLDATAVVTVAGEPDAPLTADAMTAVGSPPSFNAVLIAVSVTTAASAPDLIPVFTAIVTVELRSKPLSMAAVMTVEMVLPVL